ncbi:MAG: hypothetical protein V9F04_08810 [Dermatophilaceae bacterium]
MISLDAATAGLLGVRDGTLSAKVALSAIAELLGESAADTIAAALPDAPRARRRRLRRRVTPSPRVG